MKCLTVLLFTLAYLAHLHSAKPLGADESTPAAGASGSPAAEPEPASDNENLDRAFSIEVFVKHDCKPCESAVAYLEKLKGRYPSLEIRECQIEEEDNLGRLWMLSNAHGYPKAQLPTIHGFDQLVVGFSDEDKVRRSIDGLLEMDVYTRSQCKDCTTARNVLDEVQKKWPSLTVVYHDVDDTDGDFRQNEERWLDISRQFGQRPRLPTIHFARRLIAGWNGERSRQEVEGLISRYRLAEKITSAP